MGRSLRKAYPRLASRLIAQGRWGTLAQAGWRALGVCRGIRRGTPAGGPMLGTLFMTYRCNHDCFMCPTLEVARDRKGRGLRELDIEGLKRLVDGFADLGVTALSLTGGEPLIRSDAVDLIVHARERGLIVHLNTNGMLVDGPMAVRLVEAGVDSINLSLDGALPETHDRLRRTRGGFARVEAAVRHLRSARGRSRGPAVNLVSVVSAGNLQEIPGIADLARSWRADSLGLMPAHFFEPGSMRPRGDPGMTPERLDALDRLLDRLKGDPILESSDAYLDLFRTRLEGGPSGLSCLAGYHSLTADCFANVYRCFPFGLLGVQPRPLSGRTLPEWWASEEAARERRDALACKACVWNCHTELNLLFRKALPAGRSP